MESKSQKKTVKPIFPVMEQPATYRIEVLDRLDSSWSERLAGMSITTTGGKGVVSRRILKGQVIDQSSLTGVLNTLCAPKHPLISVAYLSAESETEDNEN